VILGELFQGVAIALCCFGAIFVEVLDVRVPVFLSDLTLQGCC
jgi:hypothetical protein